MYLVLRLAKPYAISELFNTAVRSRLSELRHVALEAFKGDKEAAWNYLCCPRKGWGDERSLFTQSLSSADGHQGAMTAIRQMQHGVYV